jgi:anti-sigma B factor antagonist
MSVKSDDYGHICVLEMQGDFTTEAVQELRKVVQERIDNRRIVDFVVDFGKCGFIDSEGLETLLWIKRTSEEMFGRLKLAQLDEHCRKILEMTRLDHRFECCADLADAMKNMQ